MEYFFELSMREIEQVVTAVVDIHIAQKVRNMAGWEHIPSLVE